MHELRDFLVANSQKQYASIELIHQKLEKFGRSNYYLYEVCGGSRNQLGKEMDISPSDVGKMLKRFKQGGGMGQNADKVLYHLAVEHGVSIDFLIDRMLRNNLVEKVGKCEGYSMLVEAQERYVVNRLKAAYYSRESLVAMDTAMSKVVDDICLQGKCLFISEPQKQKCICRHMAMAMENLLDIAMTAPCESSRCIK